MADPTKNTGFIQELDNFEQQNDFEFYKFPSLTYNFDIDRNIIRGYCDEKDAMKITIYKILETERYMYSIYSDNYGMETMDLFGLPKNLVLAKLCKRINEALTQDDRIQGIDNFQSTSDGSKLIVSFTVNTDYGDIPASKEVEI